MHMFIDLGVLRTGASIETLAKQVNTAKEDLAKARSELKAMVRLNKVRSVIYFRRVIGLIFILH